MAEPISAVRIDGEPSAMDLILGGKTGDWIVLYSDGFKRAVPEYIFRTMSIRPMEPWPGHPATLSTEGT